MPPMEITEIGTLEQIPIWPTNTSRCNRGRGPLKSRTVDTLLHILSICYADSSHIIQNPGSITNEDAPSACPDIIPNDSLHQQEMNVDITRVVLVTQEEGLCNTHVEPPERNDLSSKFDSNSSNSIDIQNQDSVPSPSRNLDQEILQISSPQLPSDKDVEEGEISGDFSNLMPEDDISSEKKTESEFDTKNLTSSSMDIDDDVGKDMAVVISKSRRNLVDYSEIALQSNLINTVTKNQDFASPLKDNSVQNNKKRRGSFTDEKRVNKKAKKSVDQSTCPKDPTMIGEDHEDTSQQVIGASANKDANNEKKKKRVLTAERKAKKKRNERIKRAETNRKLGVKRLKIQPVIKEKKVKFCRHYIKGRCHEGENCKFSHDTIPLTKSKPCCHFARHACMKGDDCPYDHELSKYPCNNYLTNGFCNRGSDCMFSHEAQPSEAEASLNASNEQKPQNSSPKLQINKEKLDIKSLLKLSAQTPKGVSFKKIDTKSCPGPALTTPKSSQPPKGISFFSQEKSPLEVEMTKSPPVIPRGINFLSFGKKSCSDLSNNGFSFKIGKSTLGNVEGKMVNLEDGVKDDTQIENNEKQVSSRKPMPVLTFLSSTSQRTLQSTLAFASKFDFGVKTSKLGV